MFIVPIRPRSMQFVSSGAMLLAMLSATGPSTAAAELRVSGPVVAGYRMSATLASPVEHAGDPVYADINIANLSSKKEWFSDDASDLTSFRVTVRNGSGQEMPQLTYGKEIYRPFAAFANPSYRLPIRSAHHYRLWINGMYDMTVPGTYTIQVERWIETGYHRSPNPERPDEYIPEVSWLSAPLLTLREVEPRPPAPQPDGTIHHTLLYAAMNPPWFAGMPGNASPRYVREFQVASTGELIPLVPGSIQTGADPFDIAVDPARRRAYVVYKKSGRIRQFCIDPTGNLVQLSPPSVQSGGSPSALALDPTGRYAYVANDPGGIAQYRITASGTLEPLQPSIVTAGKNPVSIAIDPGGKFLYAANGSCGSLDNRISQYSIGTGGRLSPLDPPDFRCHGVPSLIAINPRGGSAVAITSLGLQPLHIGRTGLLAALSRRSVPHGFWPVDVAYSPDGHFLYVANAHDSTISQYRVDSDGMLKALSPAAVPAIYPDSLTPGPTGSKTLPLIPEAIAPDPDRDRLYAGGPKVIEWKIRRDGTLAPPGREEELHAFYWSSIKRMMVISLSSAPRWKPVGHGIQMAAWTDQPTFRADQPVWLRMALRNDSSRPVQLAAPIAGTFHLDIRNDQGVTALQTRFGKTIEGAPAARPAARASIPPGGKGHFSILLNRLYDLTRPHYDGTIYTLHIELSSTGSSNPVDAALPVTFRITDPDASPLPFGD